MAQESTQRLGAGRKRAKVKKDQHLSARTTPKVKHEIERVCLKKQITKTAFIHRAVIRELKRRGISVSAR